MSGPGPVRWAGAQRDVLSGDLRGHVDLETLASVPHLYALGPLEGVRGEVSIFGGEPSIARIEEGAVVTVSSWHARACFLVWATVPAWAERALEAGAPSLDEVEREVVALARATGLEAEGLSPAEFLQLSGAAGCDAMLALASQGSDASYNAICHCRPRGAQHAADGARPRPPADRRNDCGRRPRSRPAVARRRWRA